ncbi:MAG: hypothetical protein WCQ47_05810, partial [bacterium]
MTSKKNLIVAYRVAEKISIRNLNNIDVILEATIIRRSSEEIELHTSNGARIYIFNFGSIAFFNCPRVKQKQIINKLVKSFSNAISGAQVDLFAIFDHLYIKTGEEKTRVDFDIIMMSDLDNDAIRIIALILSH